MCFHLLFSCLLHVWRCLPYNLIRFFPFVLTHHRVQMVDIASPDLPRSSLCFYSRFLSLASSLTSLHLHICLSKCSLFYHLQMKQITKLHLYILSPRLYANINCYSMLLYQLTVMNSYIITVSSYCTLLV